MRIACSPGGLPVDYTLQMANALARDDEVLVVVHAREGDATEELFEISPAVRLCRFPVSGNPLTRFFQLVMIYRTITRFNPDIIHIQDGDLLLFFISWVRRYPLATTIHDVRFHGGDVPWTTKVYRTLLLKRSTLLFVHGDSAKAGLIRQYHLPEHKVVPITMGEMNVAPFHRFHDAVPEENAVLFFGWIGEYKGLSYLIEAEPLVSREIPDFRVIIAGRVGTTRRDRDYFARCRTLINGSDRFELHIRYIPWELGATLFRRSRVVVLPYTDTTQTGNIPIAYSFRKPVIITRVGSLPELVDDGVTGIIVPPRDIPALARAIIRILKDTGLRQTMGDNAYDKLKKDMAWDRTGVRIRNAYRTAARTES
jgi:starch synthase